MKSLKPPIWKLTNTSIQYKSRDNSWSDPYVYRDLFLNGQQSRGPLSTWCTEHSLILKFVDDFWINFFRSATPFECFHLLFLTHGHFIKPKVEKRKIPFLVTKRNQKFNMRNFSDDQFSSCGWLFFNFQMRIPLFSHKSYLLFWDSEIIQKRWLDQRRNMKPLSFVIIKYSNNQMLSQVNLHKQVIFLFSFQNFSE